jgi:hypothetical protein
VLYGSVVLLAGFLMHGIAFARSPVHVTSAAAKTVAVVRCPTREGVVQPHPQIPSRISVEGRPDSVIGLVAYTNGEEFLIGPKGMICAGAVGVDGTALILVWPKGLTEPRRHSHEAGLSLFVDPACVGCQAEQACPFFTAFAKSVGFPCTDAIPSGERVERVNADLVAYEDPAGVNGDGWPSGGPDPANGIVGLFGARFRGHPEEVVAATCTLRASDHELCTASLNDAATRY